MGLDCAVRVEAANLKRVRETDASADHALLPLRRLRGKPPEGEAKLVRLFLGLALTLWSNWMNRWSSEPAT
jgi:hypothetical protein